MRAYYYTPEDLGVEGFPPGHMRLGGVTRTENPANADVFVLGPIMHHFSEEVLLNLKYLSGNEGRHFVWDLADDFRLFGEVGWNAIRCACTKHILADDPRTIPWPWPVEPWPRSHVEEVVGTDPNENYKYDVSFWGWRSPLNFTERACESLSRGDADRLRRLIHVNSGFFGHKCESDPDYLELRHGFVASLWLSRLALVPASIDGVVRYRLYEQMSMGRGLPVHICDNCVLPWPSKINWDECVVSIPEAEVDNTGDLLVEWLLEHDDADIRRRAEYGQLMFNTWLHRDKWDELFGIVARERLEGKL